MPTLVDKQVAILLKEIKAVPGVPQVMVCDNRGKVLGMLSDSNLDSASANKVGIHAAQMLGRLSASVASPTRPRFSTNAGHSCSVKLVTHSW